MDYSCQYWFLISLSIACFGISLWKSWKVLRLETELSRLKSTNYRLQYDLYKYMLDTKFEASKDTWHEDYDEWYKYYMIDHDQ